MASSSNNGPSLSGMKVRKHHPPRTKKESSWLRDIIISARSEERAKARARRSKIRASWATKRKEKRRQEKIDKQAAEKAMMARVSEREITMVKAVKSEWKTILNHIKINTRDKLRILRKSTNQISKLIRQRVTMKKDIICFKNDSKAVQGRIRDMLSRSRESLSSILTRIANSTPARIDRREKAKAKLKKKKISAAKRSRKLNLMRKHRLQLMRDMLLHRNYR